MGSINIVIEHLEPGIGKWVEKEYRHICTYALSIPGVHVIFTNVNDPGDVALMDTLLNEVQARTDADRNEDETSKSSPPRIQHTRTKCATFVLSQPPCEGRSETKEAPSEGSFISHVCVLDPFASLELDWCREADRGMTTFVFGGILGTHPMNGRTTREVTSVFPPGTPVRHLGPVQMTTDTAVITTLLLSTFKADKSVPLVDKTNHNTQRNQPATLATLPFVDHPTFRITAVETLRMKGFRYLASAIRPVAAKKASEKEEANTAHSTVATEGSESTMLFDCTDGGELVPAVGRLSETNEKVHGKILLPKGMLKMWKEDDPIAV